VSEAPDFARWCYACGDLNPIGLHLHFRYEDEWAIASFTASREHQGYPGFVHGGVVTALLDEAMGWATYGRGVWAVTGKIETRFRGAVPTGQALEVRGRIKRDRGRSLEMEAELRSPNGSVLAEADAVFFKVRGPQAQLIADTVRGMLGDTTPRANPS
jgi:acyl-coenzyme A thioesterase PaaI-like protein